MNDINNSGFIPFGSSDSRVVFSHDLKSALTLPSAWTSLSAGNLTDGFTDISTATILPFHDPVLGMRSSDINLVADAASYRLQTTNADLKETDNAGQISIEVEASWLETMNAIYNSDAYDPSGTEEAVLSFTDSVAFSASMISKNNGGTISLRSALNQLHLDYRNFEPSGVNPGAPIFYAFDRKRFVTINIAWQDKFAIAAIDGMIIGYGINTTQVNDRFANFYIGSDRGNTTQSLTNHYFRNLQISKGFPNFGINFTKSHVAVLSDSIFDGAQAAAPSTGGDLGPNFQIIRSFMQRQIRTILTVNDNGGYTVDSTTGQGAGTLHDALPLMIKPDMTDFILQGGTNDASFLISRSLFESEYKSLVEKIMGENGNPSTSVKRLICLTPPSISAWSGTSNAQEDSIIEYVDVIMGLQTWWNSTYPLRSGQLKSVNIYAVLGGTNNPGFEFFQGQVSGSGDTLHLAPRGNKVYGEAIVDAIWSF